MVIVQSGSVIQELRPQLVDVKINQRISGNVYQLDDHYIITLIAI